MKTLDKFRDQSYEVTQVVVSAVCGHCLFSKPGSLPLSETVSYLTFINFLST